MNLEAPAARARPVSPWRWAVWWLALTGGAVVFYVLLTPLWLGLRAAALLADLRSRPRA